MLATIRALHEMDIWLEIVTLLIPGFNDSAEEIDRLTSFVAGVSPDIPWHVTAFHKDYRMSDPDNTTPEMLVAAAETGRRNGLRYVYAGNAPGRVGISRTRAATSAARCSSSATDITMLQYRLTPTGGCPECGTMIPGRWASAFEGQISAVPFLPRRLRRAALPASHSTSHFELHQLPL